MSGKEGTSHEKKEMIRCPKCGEELNIPFPRKVTKELGFLLLGVVFGAALGIVGNLWVAFLFELVRGLIPQELWTVTSVLGLVLTTVLSIYILVRVMRSAIKYTTGEGVLTDRKGKKE